MGFGMDSFRALRVHNEDKVISARLEDITLDDLSEGNIVIRVEWSDINYKDALAATGTSRIMRRFPMVGGTHIATYADTAIKMVAKHNAQNKVAIYMTDGCCHSTTYLKSLEQIAKRQGITLVGIVMGGEWGVSDHPNGVFAKDGVELGKIILGHLAKAVKGQLK